ncbi:FtsX-like permease family protein [Terriglobus albidus]|uniref:FtsX-like permease family protein n=1 Tax=Terriglobus albidus TaxID=1592106 RepID=A0A5B9E8Z0_9BACT|nr:ABC transporter permease [Terriglobus albidus]QEE26961.1 FtsX-like permease family protein [Terriglobus albidus]
MRWWQIRKRNDDLERELLCDLELEEEEQRERGVPPEEAARAARRALGNVALIRERTHEAWGLAPIERFWQDLLYALRSVLRAPLLFSVAVLALGLGIGLNAGVFTLLNSIFLQPPTFKDPRSFVQIYPRYTGWSTREDQYSSFTTEDYDAIRSRSRVFEDVAAWQASSVVLEEANKPNAAQTVTCNYFRIFGVDRPLIGRFFVSEDCSRGFAAQVAVLTEATWATDFGSDPHIIGKTMHLNGSAFQVIGVVSSDAANFLPGGIFVPYTMEPLLDRGRDLFNSADVPWLGVAGRLRPGFSRADARAELSTIMSQQDRAYVKRHNSTFNRKTNLALTNGSFIENPAVRDRVVAMMALILGPLTLILLLACCNVTMLFLSRTVTRRGEIATRLALGASRGQLARMLLAESLLTAIIGGALSILLVYRVPLLVMNAIGARQSRFVLLIHPDWRVFGYLAVLVVAATIISSLMPIRAAWKLDLLTALKGRESAATVRSKTTSGLIVVQVAFGFVLVCVAVLFGRLPSLVTGTDAGFDTHHTMAVPLAVDTSAANHAGALTFYSTLESRIVAIPGVQSVAYASLGPFRPVPPQEIRLPGQTVGQGKPVSVDDISSNFFSTFGIPLLRGRSFNSADPTSPDSDSVAIVSQAFAKEFWPAGDPLGQSIVTPNNRRLIVVGIAADTKSESFGVTDGPRLYTLRDASALGGNLYVHFYGDPKPIENAIRDTVKALDRTQIIAPETIWESLEANAVQMTSLAGIILFMASVGLLMAVVGVYGVLSFAVNHRSREFGIKMVLGASRQTIFRSVTLQAIRNTIVGLLCGAAIAQPAMSTLARFLSGPFPLRGLITFALGVSAALLMAVSLVATWLPALRATRSDPMQALRAE